MPDAAAACVGVLAVAVVAAGTQVLDVRHEQLVGPHGLNHSLQKQFRYLILCHKNQICVSILYFPYTYLLCVITHSLKTTKMCHLQSKFNLNAYESNIFSGIKT